MTKWIREDLRNFKPYSVEDVGYAVKMDANESPFFLPGPVKQNIIQWLQRDENLHLYPDTSNTVLREKLATFWNMEAENITCGVGSDQIIDCIAKAFLEAGESILTIEPTFSMYAQSAVINKGRVISLADTNDIIRVAKEPQNNVKVLFLCTPNNPTGHNMEPPDIIRLLRVLDLPVVIDEAYAEFSETSMVEYIREYNNLIVLRTFSKAFGLAGARVGYALAQRELIEAIDVVRPPYNLSALSLQLAVAVLENSMVYRERVQILKKERDRVFEALEGNSLLKVYPSEANFLYIESRQDLGKLLKEQGIAVRMFPQGEDGVFRIRISIGLPAQNDLVIAGLSKLKGERGYEETGGS